jgi:hypothetical protein
MAFGLTENGENYPTKYRWSALADPGSLPTSWDESDATIAAGSDIIDETTSEILDAEPLGEYIIAYTNSSAHVLSFIGGQFIIAERPLLKDRGILAQRCVKEFFKKHFVVGDGEVYIHDGQNPTPILKGKAYSSVFPNICSQSYEKSFVVPNWYDEEMWFCYPESGCTFPNKAAIWSWKNNTWTLRDLPFTPYIGVGRLPSDAPTVTNPVDRQMVALTDAQDGLMPSATLTPAADLVPSNGTVSMAVYESSYQNAGSDMTCTIERTGLQPENSDGVFMVRAVYPLMNGGSATFYIGSHSSPNSTVTWEGPYTFTPEGTAEKIDCRVTGRYLAYKVTFPADEAGSLQGLRFDVVKAGTR